jgi:hypothetical protein
MGYWLAPGVRNVPDRGYVRIRGDQLVASAGRYELRVTNELEEALFVDRLSLVAVTHREGSDVYPNEGLFAPPFPDHRLIVTRGARVPDRVVDDRGRDVRDLVEQADRRAPSDFDRERFRGVPPTITSSSQSRHAVRRGRAAADGVDRLAFSSDNVAASRTPA